MGNERRQSQLMAPRVWDTQNGRVIRVLQVFADALAVNHALWFDDYDACKSGAAVDSLTRSAASEQQSLALLARADTAC